MSQQPPSPPPGFNVPPAPGYPPPAPPQKSNRTLWIVLGIVLGGGALLVCTGALIIGALSIAGQRVSNTFEEIESGLALASDEAYVMPTGVAIAPSAARGVGDLLEAGDLDITITAVRTDPGDAEAMPEEGNEFLLLDMQITNRNRRSVIPDDTLTYSWIQDPNNTILYCCVYDKMGESPVMEPLKPGATIDATLIYEVPRHVEPLYWVFEEFIDERQAIARVR